MCRGCAMCSSPDRMAGQDLAQGEMRHLTHQPNAPHPPEPPPWGLARLRFLHMQPLFHPLWGAPMEGRGAWWPCSTAHPHALGTLGCAPAQRPSAAFHAPRHQEREQRRGKTLGVNPLQSETPSQQGPAPHSQRGHVTGPTSSCAGACWAGRRQSQASPGPSHSWPVGDPWPSFPAQPASSQTPCLFLPFDAETISISSMATAPWLASGPSHICCLAGPHPLEEKLWGFHASPKHIKKNLLLPPTWRAAEWGALDRGWVFTSPPAPH